MKKWEKDGKEKIAISLNYNKMQINEKYALPSVNQRVLGSSPRGGALKTKHLQKCRCFFIFDYLTITSQNGIKKSIY